MGTLPSLQNCFKPSHVCSVISKPYIHRVIMIHNNTVPTTLFITNTAECLWSYIWYVILYRPWLWPTLKMSRNTLKGPRPGCCFDDFRQSNERSCLDEQLTSALSISVKCSSVWNNVHNNRNVYRVVRANASESVSMRWNIGFIIKVKHIWFISNNHWMNIFSNHVYTNVST